LLVLGPPEVHHDGQAVSFPTRKALALLTYLAVEGGLHGREKLATLFWPESDAERGRTMLRRTLAYLREGLRAADQPADNAHLLIGRDQLGFDTSNAESDLRTVEVAWSRARPAPPSTAGSEDQRGFIAQLQAAAGRYRGDFLDGFALSDAPEFDTWASVQREAWHRRMSLIFDRLSEAQLEGGALVEALETAARWIAHAPLDEAAHRRRMLIHHANGDRVAALQAYEACCAVLAAELSAEPATETEALAERIRSDKLRIENAELRIYRAPSAGAPFSILNSQFSIPMVGRLNEHAQLVTAFTAARRGHPRVMVLEGTPGVGKTRLAREFLRWVTAHDAITLYGQTLAITNQLPYQPLVDALRGHLPGAPQLRQLLDDVWLAELSQLLPELRDQLADLPPRILNSAEGRPHEFEAIARLLQGLASLKPVVLFIDDIQWADPVTRDCMLYTGRRWAESGARVLLLCALAQHDRNQPIEEHVQGDGWLQNLGRVLPLARLRLDPLPPDDALKLAELLVESHNGELPRYLAAETLGNPKLLLQTLQALREHGYVRQDEHGRWIMSGAAAAEDAGAHPAAAIPAGIREIVRDRVAALLPTIPASRRRGRRPANMPAPPTPLIGRAPDVAVIRRTLLSNTARLLTLIGPPGIGKTRLAMQVAEESIDDFEDGVCFVGLATIQDPRVVAGAIAQALAIKEAGDQSLAERLAEALRDRHMLLVLDNFEQVQPAATLVAELLAAAPWLHVLVTSRSVLHIYGEHECAVLPLPAPDLERLPAVEELAQIAAVQLFVQRAQAVNPDFRLARANAQAVAEICARLEGIPLAIELAAAWTRSLSAHALLARLSSRLTLLAGGPRDLPARQQSLRNAIAWSYDLLDADEQALLARLGVFVGGWTVATAETVVSELRIENEELRKASHDQTLLNFQFSIFNLLESLVAKSLLRRAEDADGELRFTMLEAIREYALERLAERGETELLRKRHTTTMLALAERVEPDLAGPHQGVLLDQLEREHDNMRAALSWAIERDQIDFGLRLCVALWWFWFVRGYLSEGRRWLEAVIANSRVPEPPPPSALLRAKALNAAGVLAHDQADYLRATALHEESLAIVRQLGASGGVAASLNNLGLVARSQGDYERAAAYYAESLALRRAQGDEWSAAIALSNLGLVACDQGDYERAVALFEESLALRRKLGDQRGIAMLLNSLGVAAYHQGECQRSAALHEQSLALQRELADRAGAADSLCGLGHAACAQNDPIRARRYYQESLALRRELGDQAGTAACLEGLAAVAGATGQPRHAARLMGAATALRNTIGAARLPIDVPDYERKVATIRGLLGEAAFASAWTDGQSMSVEQIVIATLDE
jgi:predicted ATPase/DNA-binding SARP family transcriptional activator